VLAPSGGQQHPLRVRYYPSSPAPTFVCRSWARSASIFVFCARSNHPLFERRGGKRTTTWWGAIWWVTCTDVPQVVHRVGAGVVQGVDGGPAAGGVAAFPGGQALGQGAVAAGLDFGGQPGQAQEGTGPGDGAGPQTSGGSQSPLPPGVSEHGATVAAGAEVCGRGVCRGRGEDSAEGDPSPTDRHQPGTQQQVVAAVYPLHVLQPPLPRPPTWHSRVHTRRHRSAQRRPGHQRVPRIPLLRGARASGAAAWALPLLSDTRRQTEIQIWTGFRVGGTLRPGVQAKSLRGRAPSQRAANSTALAISEPALAGAGFRRSRDYLVRMCSYPERRLAACITRSEAAPPGQAVERGPVARNAPTSRQPRTGSSECRVPQQSA